MAARRSIASARDVSRTLSENTGVVEASHTITRRCSDGKRLQQRCAYQQQNSLLTAAVPTVGAGLTACRDSGLQHTAWNLHRSCCGVDPSEWQLRYTFRALAVLAKFSRPDLTCSSQALQLACQGGPARAAYWRIFEKISHTHTTVPRPLHTHSSA